MENGKHRPSCNSFASHDVPQVFQTECMQEDMALRLASIRFQEKVPLK